MSSAPEPMSRERLAKIRESAEQYRGSATVRRKPNGAIAHRGELLDELDRLGNELAKLIEEKAAHFADSTTMFRGLNIRDGQAHLEIVPAREMLLVWCASVRAMLDEHQAKNYTETELEMPREPSVSLDVHDGQNPTDSYTLTLQRRHGKTPHQLRLCAEKERDEARELAAVCLDHLRNISEIPLRELFEVDDMGEMPDWFTGYGKAAGDD